MTSNARGWRPVALGEVCRKIGSGATPRGGQDSYTSTGVALIRSQNVLDLVFTEEGLAHLPDEAADALRNVTVEAGDVLLNITGQSVARCCTVPKAVLPARVNQHVAIVRPDTEKIEGRFLQYALIANKPRLLALAGAGATREALTKAMISEFEIEVPPIEEQRRIATVLGSFDGKLANCMRLAGTLEEIAGTLFRARFIDFIGHDDLVESEIGPVPRDWSIGGLAEMSDIIMGQSPPSSTYTSDSTAGPLMVQGKGVFGPRFPKREVFCSSPRRVANVGDLLMTVRAPVGDLNICGEETCLGRGVAGISSPYPGFIEFALRAGASRWRARESGTIYSAVNKQQVEDFPVVTPPASVLDEFEVAVGPIREKIVLCYRQIETLSKLRDRLLPRLLSGSLRAGEADGDEL